MRWLSPLLLLAATACEFAVPVETPAPPLRPPVAVVNRDYVVFRPAASEQPVLDLRHFDLQRARVVNAFEDDFVVLVALNDEGRRRFGDWTAANIGKAIDIYVDGKVVSSPVIQSRIDSDVVLGPFRNREEAERVLARLGRGGAA